MKKILFISLALVILLSCGRKSDPEHQASSIEKIIIIS